MIGSLRMRAVVVRAALSASLLVAVCARGHAQVTGERLVTGVVVSRLNQIPLGHAMVSLLPVGRQMFSDDQGRFAFIGVQPGSYRLRVTHLGFAPIEISMTVSRDSAAMRLRIELDQVQLRLAAVHVTDDRRCTSLGAPDPEKERDFLVVFQQLQLNAQQYRLLADSFPYAYREQRTTYSILTDSTTRERKIDTVLLRSDKPEWTYHAGQVLASDGTQGLMHLPTLSDFASDEFVRNHCFSYGGEVSTLEGTAVRIDFRAADRLRSPDVNGTILLDATSYQIRSAELRLTRIPDGMSRYVSSVTATTLFREVEPDVIVLSKVHGVWTLFPPKLDIVATIETVDDQTLLTFGFVGVGPGRVVSHP
jgi:hypothetical protein